MDYDYVIIGKEAAAYVLANRLTEYSANTVLLLEDAADLDAGIITAGSAVLDLSGHQFDFDRWRLHGCEGWGNGDVLPYFRRAAASWRGEDVYHRTLLSSGARDDGARMHDLALLHQALQTAGIRFREMSPASATDLFVSEHGAANVSHVYLRPALQRSNLVRETDARIDHITFEGRRAAGVAYQLDGVARIARANREVIVSGGGYSSPHLLLRSGIGPAGELAAAGIAPLLDLPGVGKNLRDHIVLSVQRGLVRPAGFRGATRTDRGDGSDVPLLGLPVRVCSRHDGDDANVAFLFRIVAGGGGPTLECVVALIDPQSCGDVNLTPAVDHTLRRHLDLLSTDGDRATARDGLRLARRMLDAAPLRDLIELGLSATLNVDDDAELDAFIQSTVKGGGHPVGTCTMGTSPTAVVDAALRVHGLLGLRVVDASVMPLLPGGDIHGPSIMLAERAADLIAGRPTLLPVAPETDAPIAVAD